MKKKLIVCAFALAVLVGCSSDKGKTVPILEGKNPEASGISEEDFKLVVCTEENGEDEDCTEAAPFDLRENNVLVLKAPEEIGASPFVTFDGSRFLVVPKDEKNISIINALAQALVEYSEEPCAHPCPRLILNSPIDYVEAQRMLKEDFKLTGTKEQNKALLDVLNYNLERIGEQGIPLPQAYYADIKAMAESLVNLTVKEQQPVNLSGLQSSGDSGAYCVRYEYGTCVEWVGASIVQSDIVRPNRLFLNKHEAAQIAFDIREKSDKPSEADKIFTELECKDNEDKQIYMYGVDDNFNPANPEPANPSATLLAQFPSVFSPLMRGYDHDVESINQPSMFVETLDGLPADLTQGIFAISLKEKGYKLSPSYTFYFDKYSIGSGYGTGADNADGNISIIRTTWANPSTNIYYKDMSQIMTTSGQSLLSKLQSGQTFLDTTIFYTTNVNFIAIAACVAKPKPEPTPVPEIPTKLECNLEKDEELLTVWGGVADDFAPETDPVTPSTVLTSMFAQGSTIKYDKAPAEKQNTLIDTLAHPNLHISQMEVLVNTRPIQAGGSGNDQIFIGSVATASNISGILKDPNDAGIATPNGGTAHILYGGDAVYSAANGSSAGNLLSLMNTNTSGLDVIVKDKTEVDTVRWSMCVIKDYVEPCPDFDGDGVCDADDCDPKDPTVWEDCDTPPPLSCGENIKLNLRPASTWIDAESGTSPIEQYDTGFWDSGMNWFSFDEGWEKVHNLSVDFCACGPTDVIIHEMKADNLAKIYLDDDPTPANYINTAPNTYIATRTINQNQATMASWAANESGSLHVPYSGTATDHTLHFDVKNGSGTAGGAVDGSLSFKGHLGKCLPTDLDTPEDNNTVVVPPDNNWTVTVADGSIAVITDVSWEPAPDTPVGTPGDGTVVIGIEGPIVVVAPGGKPFIDNDPSVVVNVADVERIGLDPSVLVLIDHLIDPPHYTRDPDTQIVTDHQQNLQWQDDENVSIVRKQWVTSINYNAGNYLDISGDTATTYCENLTLGGHADWRLPEQSELQGIVDYSATNPSIDTSVFSHISSSAYWSSATNDNHTHNAWFVNFNNGNQNYNNKRNNFYVRCVRAGQ